MIELRDLTVSYGPVPALSGVSLSVAPGECLLVTGPSGCGKSTLARVLTGLIPHAMAAEVRGRVQVAGLDPREHPIAVLAQQVGAVFQNPAAQLFHLTVADEVAFGPRNLGLAEDRVARRTAWAMAVTGLTGLAAARPASLSGGQQQRVALAAALAMRPRVLVLDEPTASLDVPGTRSVMDALQTLRQDHKVTIVLVEHRLADAVRLADRAVVLDGGRVVAAGDPLVVLGDRDLQKRLGLRRPTETPAAPWSALATPNGPPPSGQAPLLEMRAVSAGYDRKPAIHDVDLALYPGEFAALVGDNGAGKSTLALTAAGLRRPMSGTLRFGDRGRPRPGLDVALLFQNPAEQLFTDSVDEEVAFGPQNYRRFDPAWHERTLAEADLISLRARGPLRLSMGQQQRTALGACLALRPRLLILDEPTLGQDWGHLQRLMNFLAGLNRSVEFAAQNPLIERGKASLYGSTILLITHDYKLVHRYAERVILMEGGRITLDGRLKQPEPGAALGEGYGPS